MKVLAFAGKKKKILFLSCISGSQHFSGPAYLSGSAKLPLNTLEKEKRRLTSNFRNKTNTNFQNKSSFLSHGHISNVPCFKTYNICSPLRLFIFSQLEIISYKYIWPQRIQLQYVNFTEWKTFGVLFSSCPFPHSLSDSFLKMD